MLSMDELKEMSLELIEYNPKLLELAKELKKAKDISSYHVKVHHAYMDVYGDNDHEESYDIAKYIIYYL